MKIELTTSRILIFILLGIGYLLILISLLFKTDLNYEKVALEYVNQIDELKRKINQQQNLIEKTQLKNIEHAVTPNNGVVREHKLLNTTRPGVIILGMHRSGTSVVGGLINKMGLNTGGPLIQPAEDNKKGFFERIDVVLQNDEFFTNQAIHYSHNTYKYDYKKGIKFALNADLNTFKEGRKGLKFLNNPLNYPWMLKDPRLCITIRTWLPLLNFIPAVLFTYRHPLDVALSMNKREYEQFKIYKGLTLWYVYNRRAVEQTHDLCRVIGSHGAMMKQPQIELDRIFDELRMCGVDVPHKVFPNDVKSFVDVNLQHGKNTQKDDPCHHDIQNMYPPSSWDTKEPTHIALYRETMRVYCAFEDYSAFHPSFQWDDSIQDTG